MPQFKSELDAIRRLRLALPYDSQRGLARRIKEVDFLSDELLALANRAKGRPLASIYGAIRRFDKQQKTVTA